MTVKEKIMKLQTYKMYEGEDTVYVERDDVLKVLEQQPCEDAISREAVRKLIWQDNDKYGYSDRFHEFTQKCLQLPSVTPTSDVFDKIINKIEQTRDKDKIAEYPYNRCIRIVEEYKGGN